MSEVSWCACRMMNIVKTSLHRQVLGREISPSLTCPDRCVSRTKLRLLCESLTDAAQAWASAVYQHTPLAHLVLPVSQPSPQLCWPPGSPQCPHHHDNDIGRVPMVLAAFKLTHRPNRHPPPTPLSRSNGQAPAGAYRTVQLTALTLVSPSPPSNGVLMTTARTVWREARCRRAVVSYVSRQPIKAARRGAHSSHLSRCCQVYRLRARAVTLRSFGPSVLRA
ncbi:hypothetical protein BV20DRAFT_235158 [Pilatotrama ljubarskyi]|nr:hypothetical protein BV20DRAFT_235158 [Pilatotrama ljubarskyi]